MPQEKFQKESFQNFGGINSKTSNYMKGDREVIDLLNVDFTKPGSWTKAPGSTFYTGVTVSGRVTGLYEYEKLSGVSQIIYTAGTVAYRLDGVNPIAIRTGLNASAVTDFTTFVDTLFVTNGSEIFKWDGINASTFGVPTGPIGLTGALGGAAGLSGTFQYAAAYLTTTGSYGPIGNLFTIGVTNTAVNLSGFSIVPDYGITAIAFYRTSPGGSDLFRIGFANAGTATFVDSALPLSTIPPVDTVGLFTGSTAAPKYLEIFQNHLFQLGFSGALSTARFSYQALPEQFRENDFFEVRTNDGDRITGARTFQQQLVIGKERSLHRLSGDNRLNFVLNEITDQYGVLSNRAMAQYEDALVFLDRKGICEFNGAGVRIISTPVENVFLTMNVDAARENAVAIHNRLRNEIWFGIPTMGATLNNLTVVYDYYSKAWTKFSGFDPSSLAYIKGPFNRQTAFYGGYTGSIHFTSASLLSHNGVPMEMRVNTQFYNILGNSFTTQWRRLFVDIDTQNGATLTINFKTNDMSNTVLTRYIGLNEFQKRLDFGIPSKSLAMEFIFTSASFPLVIDGFTLEGRLQRKV